MTDLKTQKQNCINLASSRQRQATAPEVSAWVEASAGTGKTKVLSDRVLRMLLNGAAPHKILCLTYTKAAAVEMSSRIAAKLSQWAVAEDGDLQKQLSGLLGREILPSDEQLLKTARKLFAILLDTPGGMKIQTIHSFCQEILKRFPLEAHISPYFEVMDDRRAGEILQDLKKKLLEKAENEPQSPEALSLNYLTSHTSEFTFPEILNAITSSRAKIARLLEKYSSVNALLAATAKSLGLSFDDTPEKILKSFFDGLDVKMLQNWIGMLSAGSKTDQEKAFVLEKLICSENKEEYFEDYKNIFLTKDGDLRKTIFTKGALKGHEAAETEIAKEALRVQELSSLLRRARLLESTTAVLYLAEGLISAYTLYKNEHSLMDYEDLILLTRRLLETPGTASWVLYKLDGGIDNILIDEAQDTSPDQWGIIRALTADFFSGESLSGLSRTIFAVGDRKQSIYSFQGADPQEFEAMRLHFQKQAAAREPLKEVQMDVSFRSTGAVLDLVNHLFSRPEVKQGVARAETDITHSPARIGESGRIEIWPLVEPENDENPDIWLPPVERRSGVSTSSRLAMDIALKIRSMVTNHELLLSKNRPVRYKDFLVLVQKRGAFVEEFVRACKNTGVEIAGVDKISLLEQIAIKDLIALGKFLLLPEDELNLASLLKSPLFNLNDEDLFILCHNRGDKNLWQCLKQNPQYSECCQALYSLLNMADTIRPYELYAYVLDKLQGRKKFLIRLGNEAADGLDEFINLSLNFEQEHVPSLQNFISWIEGDEVEIKRELEQSDIDAVRIMTVHGSKGLQAPIVILPDTVRVKTPKKEAGLLLDDLLYYPLGADYYDEHCEKIKEQKSAASIEEYKRLLYVAVTRAEDRLYICGWKGAKDVNDNCWYKLCAQSLEQMGHKNAAGTICYETAQQSDLPAPQIKAENQRAYEIPSWINMPAPEISALERPLAPSKMEEDDEETVLSPLAEESINPYRRGRIMHKLLQFLPGLPREDYPQTIDNYLQHNAVDLPETEKEYIKEKVFSLLENPSFKMFFSKNSKAEVPLMGEVGGKIISGQIDRLVEEENQVTIIDFKTNRPAAKSLSEIPNAYWRQMEAYKALVEKIYPDKEVRCGILWTDTAQFMLLNLKSSLI